MVKSENTSVLLINLSWCRMISGTSEIYIVYRELKVFVSMLNVDFALTIMYCNFRICNCIIFCLNIYIACVSVYMCYQIFGLLKLVLWLYRTIVCFLSWVFIYRTSSRLRWAIQFIGNFSSSETKARVIYCDRVLSVVHKLLKTACPTWSKIGI